MHSLRYSIYHKILRTSAVLVAAVLAFQSGAIVPGTALLGSAAERYLANTVSMSASVVPNSENTLATELKARETELDSRERSIDARAKDTASISGPYATYILSSILLGQLLLIIANYVFDYLRERRRRVAPSTAVPVGS